MVVMIQNTSIVPSSSLFECASINISIFHLSFNCSTFSYKNTSVAWLRNMNGPNILAISGKN